MLDKCSSWVPAFPPAKPVSYGELLKPSDYERGYLAMVYPHITHFRLNFEVASHTYFVDGRAAIGSVTYLAGFVSRPFDGEWGSFNDEGIEKSGLAKVTIRSWCDSSSRLEAAARSGCLGIVVVQVTASERRSPAAIVPGETEHILEDASAKENPIWMFQAWQFRRCIKFCFWRHYLRAEELFGYPFTLVGRT